MGDFARKPSKQIDNTISYSIVGVSFGGMLATELADFLQQEIPLLKTYKSIIFVGSVAPRNVFEQGFS